MTNVTTMTLLVSEDESAKIRSIDATVHKASVCRSTTRMMQFTSLTAGIRTYVWQCKTAKAATVIRNRLLDAGYDVVGQPETVGFENVTGVELYTAQAGQVVQTREFLRQLAA